MTILTKAVSLFIGMTIVVAELKVVLKANYSWIQISRMRRSLKQIKQFEVTFQTKSINSCNSKKIPKCKTQFKFTRDCLIMKTNTIQIKLNTAYFDKFLGNPPRNLPKHTTSVFPYLFEQ